MGTILLIEDNSDHATLINHGLAEGGDRVIHQSNGQEALQFLNRTNASDRPNLVILDLKLPGMDGFETLQAIRSNPKLKLLPVVILTTSKYIQEINRAYELGASGFVTKSEDFPELLSKLKRVKDYWIKTVERPE